MDEKKTEQKPVENELIEVASPETEIAKIMVDDEPEIQLARLQKVAELAPRMEEAMKTILMACTFPEDWQVFEDSRHPEKSKVCLSSAGAERVAKHFGIKIFSVSSRKEEYTDEKGKAFRYIFEGEASMGGRLVHAQGSYSTRDKFLGYANEEWRNITEINEGNIRNAAYHIFIGNCIKCLLGLRNMPISQYQRLMSKTGQNAQATTAHIYTPKEEKEAAKSEDVYQKELNKICFEIAELGYEVICDTSGNPTITELPEFDDRSPLDVGQAICITISSFKGDKGIVRGKISKDLKGKWLFSSLKKAKTLYIQASERKQESDGV